MKYHKTKMLSPNKKKLLIILVVLVVAVVCAVFLLKPNSKQNTSPETTATSASNDLSPATEEEVAQAEDHKKQLAEQKTPAAPTEANPASVTPFISYAGQSSGKVEVASFIPGISEDGGVCEVTISQGSSSVTKQVPANRNSSTTDCQLFSFARNEFSSGGKWLVTVRYSSKTASGTSEQQELVIQ